MATFPTYAKILLEGYSETPDYGVLRTEMDGGIAKQRPRWSKAIVTRDAQIKVSNKTDKASFDTWARTDLNGGAGWFTWTDPLTETSKQARIVGGKYKWSSPGIIWIAQCQIEAIG
jgi:hypothetical protein